MIEKISDNSGVSPAANSIQKAASTKTLCQTPFGDVMVDELSTPNLAGIFSGGLSAARSATAAAQPAVAKATAQSAKVAATMNTAVAASTERTATAATMKAAVTAPTEQTATATAATMKAAVAASTEQTATATAATMKAAVAAPSEQTAATSATAATTTAAAATTVASTEDTAVAADASTDDSAPTAESVFGADPWVTDPTGTAPDGSSYAYNPMYFATASTAAQVAEMVGGTVVNSDQLADAGGFVQQQPNEMVKLANGTLINPGLVASFYTHGYSQSFIDTMIQNETQGT